MGYKQEKKSCLVFRRMCASAVLSKTMSKVTHREDSSRMTNTHTNIHRIKGIYKR